MRFLKKKGWVCGVMLVDYSEILNSFMKEMWDKFEQDQ